MLAKWKNITRDTKFKLIKNEDVGPKRKNARNVIKALYGHEGICESCTEIHFWGVWWEFQEWAVRRAGKQVQTRVVILHSPVGEQSTELSVFALLLFLDDMEIAELHVYFIKNGTCHLETFLNCHQII